MGVRSQRAEARQARAEAVAECFNRDNPVGTPVRFWPMRRSGYGIPTVIRGPAYAANGEALILVEGHSGVVALSHVFPARHRSKAWARAKSPAEAAEFNSRNPVGTPVEYWTGLREGPGVRSRTRTAAFAASVSHASVFVEGLGTSVSLSHVRPVAAGEEVS